MKILLAICVCMAFLPGGYPRETGLPESEQVLKLLHRKAPSVKWDMKSILRGEFNPDYQADFAMLGQEGKTKVFVGVVYGPVASNAKVDILEFGVGQDQGSICQLPAHLAPESLNYDPADEVGKIPGFRPSKRVEGLNLTGGECDSFHIFWNYKSRHLDWWRM